MKLLKVASFFVPTILAGAIFIVLNPPHEPTYRGRRLTQWLNDAGKGYDPLSPKGYLVQQQTAAASETAVREIGTNAVPTLARLAGSTTLFRETRLHNRALAIRGFHLLADSASNAYPALLKLTMSPDRERRECALMCLRELSLNKDQAVAAFVPLLRDSDHNIKFYAAEALCEFPDSAEKAGVFDLFPSLRALEESTTNLTIRP